MTKFKILSPEGMQRAIINNTDVPMGQAVAEEQHKDTLRQVVEMLDGIENPHFVVERVGMDTETSYNIYPEFRIFYEAIQTIKQSLKEEG